MDSLTILDRDAIIGAIAKHFCIFAVKSELDQLLCGFSNTLDILNVLRSNAAVLRPLFVSSVSVMNADDVFDAFNICYLPEGSNKRSIEEATIMLWVNFLQTIERKLEKSISIILLSPFL